KLFAILTHWPQFHDAFEREGIVAFRRGWVFYGGFIAAATAAAVYVRSRGIDVGRAADWFGPAVPLGHAVGRVGCFLAGCCYGAPCDLPWAVRFPSTHTTLGLPVHPTQLYEVAGNLALFGLLTWFYPRRRHYGQVFLLYLAGYATLRF